MNNCGSCTHFTETRSGDYICSRTGKPAGYLQVKQCHKPRNTMEQGNNTPKTKICKRCGRELPVSEFGHHARSKDGLQPYCRECRSAQFKEARGGVRHKKETPLVYDKRDLADIPDDGLLDELRRRGYEGKITKKVTITL